MAVLDIYDNSNRIGNDGIIGGRREGSYRIGDTRRFVVAMEDGADVDAIASGVVMEEEEVGDEENNLYGTHCHQQTFLLILYATNRT